MANKTLMAMTLSNVTATTNGGDLENLSSRGAHIVIKITGLTGTSATFTVQGKDALSGDYYTILASAALTGTGTTVLRIYPGLTASANLVASDVIPRFFRVIMTAASLTDLDATVGVSLID
jgi:hypothetical protein